MKNKPGKDRLELSFESISCAIKKLRLAHFDLVVGVGRGGIIPSCLIANKIGCDLRIIRINYRDQNNIPKHGHPRAVSGYSIPQKVNKILIVDDVAVSGMTLELARRILKNYYTKTLVLVGKADYVVFPKISSCVKWPW